MLSDAMKLDMYKPSARRSLIPSPEILKCGTRKILKEGQRKHPMLKREWKSLNLMQMRQKVRLRLLPSSSRIQILQVWKSLPFPYR
jgi:hypothetical protein